VGGVSAVALVEARGLTKSYGGAQALRGVDLSVEAGEVHCLVGENGAGKSTLGKVIAGVVRPDGGTLAVNGREVDYRSPRDALADGITIVEQELSLVPAMTVADNVMLGMPRRRDRRALVKALIEQHDLGLEPDCPVERLAVADQQKVEILRALARHARLIVMDEPTARLAAAEARNLQRIVRRLADAGTGVVYVSHFLDEVLEVGDRVTVLRNGAYAAGGRAAEQTTAGLVSAMLGREASFTFPPKRPPAPGAPSVLDVRDLAGAGHVRDVTFTVRAGEILGLAGLVGSGRTEIARLVFGADRRRNGHVALDGRPLPGSIRGAIDRGVAYVPESRKDLGLFLRRANQENATLAHVEKVSRAGIIMHRRERREAKAVLERLRVTPPDPSMPTGRLSGGNQQKVLFARWLWQRPRLLIADEPTRGVDVAAKFAIYDLLARMAADGTAVLLISSELDEIVGLAHRVLVMARGRPSAMLSGEHVCEDRILHAAFETTKAAP
jgi:simple sugar transport system ATP-binding protein/ribose transport system ATP-binding protein